jgi:glycosyltransferase involved in cell wall biosynthesis
MIEHPYYGWLAWLIKRSAKVTWIVHSHNIEFQRSRSIGRWWWPALKWYERWVYRKADLVFFISGDDRYAAISELGIDEKKSFVITYGVEISEPPSDNQECRTFICDKHGIDSRDVIMLFNGALYHHSNYEPVQIITEIINPLLLSHKSLRYKIIICGKGLPESFDELKSYRDKNIIYAGFVEDISIYFKAADIFLNPIVTGAGVKTKAIEAIAYNCTVVSTELGALGLNRDACGEKLHVVSNNDWKAFAGKVIEQSTQNARTGGSFYEHYYWGNIAQKVVKILNEKAPV